MVQFLFKSKQVIIHFFAWLILVLLISQVHVARNDYTFLFLYRILFYGFIFYLNFLVFAPLLLLRKKLVLYGVSVVLLLGITQIFKDFIFPGFFRMIGSENVNNGPMSMLSITFVVIGSVVLLYRKYTEIEVNRNKIQMKHRIAELNSLKNQLNPHFLFNSLNSIYSLTSKKSELAPEAVIKLSELMRYMLYKAKEDYVLLSDELSYIQNYYDLQMLRIANNATVKLTVKGKPYGLKIAPLLLISFIENAFKFGVDSDGNVVVEIQIDIRESELLFNCKNVIGDQSMQKNESGVGIDNTVKRLKLLYPSKMHTLKISDDLNTFQVSLKLKLK